MVFCWQNRTMVFWGYLPSDLISVVLFYFNGEKTKRQADVQVKLFIGQGKPKRLFTEASHWKAKICLKMKHEKIHKIIKKIIPPFEATRTLFWSAWNNCSNNQTKCFNSLSTNKSLSLLKFLYEYLSANKLWVA